jgi:hypothetical protein
MGDQKLNFKNFKQRGEWVEMLFMARAAREGLQVSKPYGDSASYDFIVESGALCSVFRSNPPAPALTTDLCAIYAAVQAGRTISAHSISPPCM